MVLIPVIICRIHFKLIVFVQFLHIFTYLFLHVFIFPFMLYPQLAACLMPPDTFIDKIKIGFCCCCVVVTDFHQQVASTYSAFFGQVQDMAFLPRGNEFISAAEVVRRNILLTKASWSGILDQLQYYPIRYTRYVNDKPDQTSLVNKGNYYYVF